MVKPIMKDVFFLNQKSEPATKADHQVIQDLLDTLKANEAGCVGMAANMIGVKKKIIAFLDESGKKPAYTVMLNPEIIQKKGEYSTEEGCLSLLGEPRKCTRYKSIKVSYMTVDGKPRIKAYEGWTAQIIQHEVDHLSGILI